MEEIKKILVDNRELKNKVCKYLYLQNFELISKQMLFGDYQISDDLIIERKSAQDYLTSLMNGRLFKQLILLKNNCEKPLLILENYEQLFGLRDINKNAIISSLNTIIFKLGIPIMYTNGEKETSEFISNLFKKHYQKITQKSLNLHNEKKTMVGNELLNYIMSSFPNIGINHAKKLLKEKKTLKKISNSRKEDLQKIEGIGVKKSEEIFETFNLEYED